MGVNTMWSLILFQQLFISNQLKPQFIFLHFSAIYYFTQRRLSCIEAKTNFASFSFFASLREKTKELTLIIF